MYPKNNSLMQYCYRTFPMFLSKFRRNCMLYLTYLGFPGGSDCKESACNARDLGLILNREDPLEKGMATYFSILA